MGPRLINVVMWRLWPAAPWPTCGFNGSTSDKRGYVLDVASCFVVGTSGLLGERWGFAHPWRDRPDRVRCRKSLPGRNFRVARGAFRSVCPKGQVVKELTSENRRQDETPLHRSQWKSTRTKSARSSYDDDVARIMSFHRPSQAIHLPGTAFA